MKITSKLAAVVLAAGSIGGVAASSGDASALFTGLNASRINWQVTCRDGLNTLTATPRASYVTASPGYYQTRIVLYRSNDTQYRLGPLSTNQYWTGEHMIPSFNFRDETDLGQYQVTAFVSKWNGSSYTLVARESKSCAG